MHTQLDASALNWRAMKAQLSTLNEAECWALIKSEQAGKNRAQWLLRMYGRASKLREERERQTLLIGGTFELPHSEPYKQEPAHHGNQDSGSDHA